uniref:Origin recognition complex subunit 2 n=1 Tax=Anisakis simplex TaxID=6269 RepID=A0A0M3KIC1_ANISI
LQFYGIGSKRALLQAFCDEFLSDLTHVVVDAFYPSVTTRIILQEMLNAFNFVFINVDTMLAYKEELFASESKLLGLNAKTSGRAHSQASLDVLWASLTFNSRMVLHKLAKLYYARKQAIEFFDLYRQSRYIVHSVVIIVIF